MASAVVPGSLADRLGVTAGAVLAEVDGKPTHGLERVEQLRMLMRGQRCAFLVRPRAGDRMIYTYGAEVDETSETSDQYGEPAGMRV